jgi:hypothetical protein
LIEITSNNEDEVREEWEKIQISYMSIRPAMRRAAMEATVHGVASIGKGLFSLGQMTVENLSI